MIIGIGSDIVDIKRIEKSINKFGQSGFLSFFQDEKLFKSTYNFYTILISLKHPENMSKIPLKHT